MPKIFPAYKKITAVFSAGFILFFQLPASAMLSMELTRGVSGAIPIAVVSFSGESSDMAPDLSSVIANDLGWVLRQILLFSSQTYVLMDQLLQTQKQMLATLAMTNTLLVANSNYQASILSNKAQGI